jgi:hypothetical protein
MLCHGHRRLSYEPACGVTELTFVAALISCSHSSVYLMDVGVVDRGDGCQVGPKLAGNVAFMPLLCHMQMV